MNTTTPASPQLKIATLNDIPVHLKPYVVAQEPELYTPMDHAAWRFIMKISMAFFAQHAHPKYLDGLKATGISPERIPLLTEMDEKLSQFGWHCVGVAGFIPPAIFLEFLSLGVLPIACDMRKFEHIAYTPAPDIVHESAGHAPIIAAPDYARYLHNYGEVARRAIFSHKDLLLYEAIRHLSDVKEDPHSTEEMRQAAQRGFEKAYADLDIVSEATKLARMSWWTIEYGLVGTLENFKIYGAGLLSSVDESYNCIRPHVVKFELDASCIEQSYDITKPQPQLYIAKDFQELNVVLDEFAETMAFRRGGFYALERAREAQTVTTTELDCGLQICGILESFEKDAAGELAFLKFSGPMQLAHEDHELRGLGPAGLTGGFLCPVGKLKNCDKSLHELSVKELQTMGYRWNQKARLEWTSGYVVEGVLASPITRGGRRLALELHDARILDAKGKIVFEVHGEERSLIIPCAKTALRTFGGAADRPAYLSVTDRGPSKLFKHKSNLTAENEDLNKAYALVREMREKSAFDAVKFRSVITTVADHPHDWLIRFEILEQRQAWKLDETLIKKLLAEMEARTSEGKHVEDMLSRGKPLIGLNS
ncbi:MAG TPA: aromatic amino acid hydroxylase [Bdellovibrionota bacterium]|jgi:phenylalanine-4-hydroxylase|nr:aromatic amino acid hydroxylase [Bdellovibrionota bacterium]